MSTPAQPIASGDALDELAQPAPAPTPQPSQQPQQTVPGGDALDELDAQQKPAASIAEAHKSWWDWAGKSVLDDVSGGLASKQLAHENEIGQQIINHEIAQAHPWRAALAQFYYGSLKDAANVGMQLTTPANLALALSGASRIRAIKALASAANLYFAYRGGQELFADKQANETSADVLQRRLFALAGISGGIGGAAGSAEDVANITRQNTLDKLGLSGDLAAKVQAKVDQVHNIRQRAALENAQQTSDVLDTQQQIQGQAPIRMGQILRDAAHAVESEYARVSKPFEEMSSMAEKPISDAATVRATILDTIKGHGVQDQEIPPKIFNALPKRGIGGGDVFLDIPKGPAALQVPELAEGFEAATKPVSFKDITRVRADLWDAANGAKDGTVKSAMFDAYDSMTQMQEDYAQKNGFGEKYAAAKEDYKNFKRELGSGLMSDFLRAGDFKEQAMAPRIAKLMTGTDAEAMRGLLKIAGVDTTPLDELVSGKPVKRAIEVVGKTGEKAATGAEKEAARQIRELGKQDPIIPGRSDLKLAGKTTEEIRSEAIKKLANSMKQQGISNPMGWIMTIYGAIRISTGSPFGVYQFGRGASALTKGRLLRNPSFQDWVIRESGVDPSNLTLIQKMRRGMDRSGAIARVATQMGENAQDQTGTSP